MKPEGSVTEKYTLTIKEASAFYHIGIKKLRSLAAEHLGSFAITNGSRYLINRRKFEEFLDRSSSI